MVVVYNNRTHPMLERVAVKVMMTMVWLMAMACRGDGDAAVVGGGVEMEMKVIGGFCGGCVRGDRGRDGGDFGDRVDRMLVMMFGCGGEWPEVLAEKCHGGAENEKGRDECLGQTEKLFDDTKETSNETKGLKRKAKILQKMEDFEDSGRSP
ncbi:hypothetical protein Tco_0167119 [Tanacetum coccineum]